MYDIKPQVNSLLESIPGVSVSDTYPSNFNNMPHISFYEIANTDPLRLNKEYLTDISIQVDVWHNRSTWQVAQQVETKMRSIGLVRKFAADVPDPSGIKHKTMRFRGVIDNRNLLVYQ
jgi:hypothetical protein